LHNKNRQDRKENISEAIAKYESLAEKALKSGNALAANRNRFMAAVYRSMLDRS
jgi:hypothetical protein